MEKKNSVKGFMNLSKVECIIAAKETLKNSNSMYNDALVLAQNKSYGRATSLLILSMEENMKSVILYLDGNGFQFRQRVKGINNLFINHKLRYPLALVLSGMNIFRTDMTFFISRIKKNPNILYDLDQDRKRLKVQAVKYFEIKMKQLITEITWFSEAEYLRQEGIYVDYNEKLKSPLSISEHDFNEVLIRVEGMKNFTNEFLVAFDATDENVLDDMQKEIKELQGKFITEGWYKKLGKLISKFGKRDSNPLKVLLSSVQEFIVDRKNDEL